MRGPGVSSRPLSREKCVINWNDDARRLTSPDYHYCLASLCLFLLPLNPSRPDGANEDVSSALPLLVNLLENRSEIPLPLRIRDCSFKRLLEIRAGPKRVVSFCHFSVRSSGGKFLTFMVEYSGSTRLQLPGSFFYHRGFRVQSFMNVFDRSWDQTHWRLPVYLCPSVSDGVLYLVLYLEGT